jgi:hypothetical protein
MIIACLVLRVGVYQRGGQPRQRVQQVVLGVDRDPVRLDRAGTGIGDNLAFGAQAVPDPAQPTWPTSSTPGVARRVCST